jgi:hypothetical protein
MERIAAPLLVGSVWAEIPINTVDWVYRWSEGAGLGDHCRVGPNAVVPDDVPRGAAVVGVPA